MNRNTILMSIAGLSIFIHVCMTLFTVITLVQIIVLLTENDGNYGAPMAIIIVILVVSLILEIALVVVSIYLIQGIKKERHQYVASWVYTTGIYTVVSVMGLINGSRGMSTAYSVKIFIIILHAAMWYPVYKFWRDLKTKPNPNVPENAPLNVGYTTQTPGTIYNTGPGNWQQAPAGANYYPPPGYGPQMQTEQIQPTANPQLATGSYPRHTMTTAEGAETTPSYAKENEQVKSHLESK